MLSDDEEVNNGDADENPPRGGNSVVVPRWSVAIDGKTYGPYNDQTLKQMILSGVLSPSTMAWRPGAKGWAALDTYAELGHAIPVSIESEPEDEPLLRSPIRFDLPNLMSRDTWTRDDSLGYSIYAKAISDSILDGTTLPPLTIGIQAPWGQGKTSLMRMIQQRLDPRAPERDEEHEPLSSIDAMIRTKYRDLLRWIREWRDEKPSNEGGMLGVGKKQVPTVWFNPLYYRESSQIWAGLAHAILHQLARQLDPIDREKFWLRLQISRMNAAAIRRDVHQYLLMRAVPAGLAVVALAVTLSVTPLLAGASGTLVGCFTWVWGKIHTIDRRFDKYVTEPDYQSQLGLLHLVDHDLDLALRLLAGTRPIAVFIDDLDRCDPQTVNQVILAINQFLSLPRRTVFFFLGMDMEMVAAALEQAQREILPALPNALAQKRSFGWRFMEKFVQLPFVIPRLDPDIARSFATAHLSGASAPRETASMKVAAIRHDVGQVMSATEVGEIARRAFTDETLDAAHRAELQEAFSSRASELMRNPESDELQKIVATAIDDLELNPRTIKRYFGLVRLLRNIQLSTGAVESPQQDRLLVLRAAHLLLNWPQFVQWVRNHPSLLDRAKSWKTTIDEIEAIASDANDYASWCTEIDNLFGDKAPSFFRDVSLFRYLAKLSGEPPGLRAMDTARMF